MVGFRKAHIYRKLQSLRVAARGIFSCQDLYYKKKVDINSFVLKINLKCQIKKLSKKIKIVGDDLFVTSTERLDSGE